MSQTEFSLGLRFAGSAHLAGPDGNPIWPPEPCRVVAAMVATASHHRFDPAPLRCLESLGPDVFYCEDALPAPGYQLSVPGNHNPKHHLALRGRPYLTLPRTRLHAAYTWQVPSDHISVLTEIGRRISHVGAGASLVTSDVLSQAPLPTLVPDRDGNRSLRCAPREYVQALLDAFQRGMPAPYLGQDIRYRWADQSVDEPSGPWSATSGALRLVEPVDVADGVHFAAAVRSAVMSLLEFIPPEVHGHHETPRIHVAWVPVPHRDVLLGIGCWLPRSMGTHQAQQVLSAFARLRHVRFRGRVLKLSLGGQGLLRDRVWAGFSDTWRSVTAIALLRHPRRKLTADDIIAEGLVSDGYPEPGTIHITRWGDPVRARRSHTPRVHAVITWPQPIRGPVLVGAERHFGLGLCQPIMSVYDTVR